MDRIIAPNSVPASQADAAPTTGTPQYATDGNPAANVPATQWPAYQYNAIQEELIAIQAAAGLSPDRANNAQVIAAIRALIQASSPVVGSARNLTMSVAAASASATLSADEIVVGTALGGQKFVLGSFSKTINLATTGVGGMDTGSAPTSGFVALYAVFDPTSGASALLATNATSAVAPNVYGGANMPSGYAASALVSVWPTNSSGQFVAALQRDRHIAIPVTNALTTTTQQSSLASLSLSSTVPKNAISVDGIYTIAISGAGASQLAMAVSGAPISLGQQTFVANMTWAAGQGYAGSFRALAIQTAQTMYYVATLSAGVAGNIQLNICGYDF